MYGRAFRATRTGISTLKFKPTHRTLNTNADTSNFHSSHQTGSNSNSWQFYQNPTTHSTAPPTGDLELIAAFYGGSGDGIDKNSRRGKYNFIAAAVKPVRAAVCTVKSQATLFGGRLSVNAGHGSGFFVHEEGLVVTNAHVVMRGQKKANVSCITDPEVEYPATILYRDEICDLAVLAIDQPRGSRLFNTQFSFTTVKVAALNQMIYEGEHVIAIGSPLQAELEGTITTGIVSCAKRSGSVYGMKDDTSMLQHTASLAPGNSGGPLINLDSEVVGVNQSVFLEPGSLPSSRYGFSIPSDRLRQFLDEKLPGWETEKLANVLANKTSRKHYCLGISVSPYTIDDITYLANNVHPSFAEVRGYGLLVTETNDHEYFQQYDIILDINGKAIRGSAVAYLRSVVQSGKSMKLRVWRHGKVSIVDVTPKLAT